MIMPKYPIFIPSRGRYESGFTMKFLKQEGVPFILVVEPQEKDIYEKLYGGAGVEVLTLPENDRGLIYARNWIKQYSTKRGDARHWQIDDNIRGVQRLYKGKRLPCDSGPAFRCIEDFSDRYENVGLSGMNYVMFGVGVMPPFYLNVHVYSCTLVNNEIPYSFRQPANEDVDMCLQVLSSGKWCTVLFNTFLAHKMRTMTISGGQCLKAYTGDGRLYMARQLQRKWPGIVTTGRRFKRPQHIVRDSWRKFDTPLKLKPGVVIPTTPNEYGLQLQAVKEVKSDVLKQFIGKDSGQ